jgi:predicted amidohydrolase
MKDKVTVAAVQMSNKWLDNKANLDYMKYAIERAKTDMGADLVVFPELCNTGYIMERDKEFGRQYFRCAERIPGPTSEALVLHAKEFGVYVVAGLAEQHPEIPGMLYNSAVLISPKSGLLGFHRKMHIPGEEKHYFIAGSTCDVFKTDIGNIGMVICYDGQFPEYTRMLALKGAEILCMIWNMPTFSNQPELLHYITAVRAAENRMYAISCNRIGTDGNISFFGHSVISDPVGNLLAAAKDEETIVSAVLQADVLLAERALQPVFRDRRPEMYSYLTRIM